MKRIKNGKETVYCFTILELFTFVSIVLAVGAFLMASSDVIFWTDMLQDSAYGGMKIKAGGQMYSCDIFNPYSLNLTGFNDTNLEELIK